MAIVKRHDFVEIGYTGRIKEDNAVFDTTEEKVARDNGIYNKDADYSSLIICVGENHLLKGLEEQLIGRETGKEYTLEISPENAFGRKDAKLIQLIPASKFRQQSIQPIPGLQLNIDGVFGIIKTVSGGRCLVDFNHPLAGKELVYDVRINRIVDDSKEKLNSMLKTHLNIKDAEIELKEASNASDMLASMRASSHATELVSTSEMNASSRSREQLTRSQLTAEIKLKQNLPEEAQKEFRKIAENTIPEIKDITFAIAEENKTNKFKY